MPSYQTSHPYYWQPLLPPLTLLCNLKEPDSDTLNFLCFTAYMTAVAILRAPCIGYNLTPIPITKQEGQTRVTNGKPTNTKHFRPNWNTTQPNPQTL